MSDRQASILTGSQREYLFGEADLSVDGERKARQRIRERVREGILDLALLTEVLADTEDFDMIFEDFESWNEFQQVLQERARSTDQLSGGSPPTNAEDGREMTNAIHGAVGFLWLAVSNYGGLEDGTAAFENVTETAIEDVEKTKEYRTEADVEIELTQEPRPTDVIEKYEAGEPLTEEEFQTLIDEGEANALDLLRREGVIKD